MGFIVVLILNALKGKSGRINRTVITTHFPDFVQILIQSAGGEI
jgi:hypothetical protein